MMVSDGWGVIIEVASGTRYHITGADNPQVFCSEDDRRLLTVVDALLPGVAWHCPPVP
jgi:hypothetical protein